jgi:Domain of unknown function (DUF4270)
LQKRFLPTAFLAASLLVIGYGCTKFDTTSQGGDLLTIDNINTFADTLGVIATQGIFNNVDDSTILRKTENHVIGNITNDPEFGTTDARIYVQFKPTIYPFYFGFVGDTVKNGTTGQASPFAGFDSAFVCLSFRGIWGDSSSATLQQTFEINSIDTLTSDFRDKTDTLRRLDYKPNVTTSLGTATITPQIVASKVFFGRGTFKDSAVNQIRIKLSTPAGIALAKSLFEQDSSSIGGFNSDEKFRKLYGGFEIRSISNGNSLYYVNLADAKTRLEFHYHKIKNGIKDTAVQSFQMYPQATGSALTSSSANYIKRNYATSSIPAVGALTNDVYIQTAPGTFANISIPDLNTFKNINRTIHRAYLIIEQNPSGAPTDVYYTPPPYLYLDLKDTSTALPQRYKPVPFDLSNQVSYNPDATGISPLYHPYPANNVDVNNFGGAALKRFDGANTFYRYEINITRYVQNMVTNGNKNYDFRLYAPFTYFYPQYEGAKYVIPYFNPLALGRVKVGTGTNTNNHKMKLVIVYSKL